MEGAANGGKRKIDDEIELAKQKAQAIAARFLNDVDSKRPRTTGFDSVPPPPPPQSSIPSSQPSFPVSYASQTSQYNGVPSSKKIVIPNGKVGVIIGRGGDMIKNLQQRSGARIQITRDADSDPTSLTRDVELMGTQEQISRAEELITEVIAETDAASSASSGNRGGASVQPGSEQFVMKVPNDKVALVIGKGGETIKAMQNKSGARIQVVPLHLPPGDTSTERNVFINGTQEQIEAAKELVNEVISGNRLKVLSGTNTYNQSAYASGGGWAPQGQPQAQQPSAYGYAQPGSYAMPPPPPPYYGGYPPQPTAWEQPPNPAAPTQQQNATYNAYGQAQPTSTPTNASYNYAQSTGYTYDQGYPQSYGQDQSSQTPDQTKSYGPPPTTEGTPAAPTSDGTAQSQQPSSYASGYAHPPANGYGAYPTSYPAGQPAYSQGGYPQMATYGQQQDGQVSNQASYPYYAQSGYYQGAYPQAPQPPQTQAQGAANGGDSTTGSGGAVAAEETEKPQS